MIFCIWYSEDFPLCDLNRELALSLLSKKCRNSVVCSIYYPNYPEELYPQA